MRERNETKIKALIKDIIWPGAGGDPAEIIMIQPFENDRFNENWDASGMAIKVRIADGSEILFPGRWIDDDDHQRLIDKVRAFLASRKRAKPGSGR